MTRIEACLPLTECFTWSIVFAQNVSILIEDFNINHALPLCSPLQVFMKESLEQRLEKDRDEVRRAAAMVIRAHLLAYSAR